MSYPRLSSSHRRLNRLKYFGMFLLGTGLGAMGMKLLTPKVSTPTYAPQNSGVLNVPGGEAQRSGEQFSRVEADVASATVCVKTVSPEGEACASGVSIDPQLVGIDSNEGAVVLTNFHVLMGSGGRPRVQLGGTGQVFSTEAILESPEFDLALLRVPDAQFPIAALADTSPVSGDARAIGFPNNRPLTIKDSVLLGKTQNCLAVSPCLAMQQGTITHGNSGGPLEADGKVIGITQGEIVDEIAIPVEQIRQFLAGETPPPNRFPPRNEPGFPPMRPPARAPFPFGEPYPPPRW